MMKTILYLVMNTFYLSIMNIDIYINTRSQFDLYIGVKIYMLSSSVSLFNYAY